MTVLPSRVLLKPFITYMSSVATTGDKLTSVNVATLAKNASLSFLTRFCSALPITVKLYFLTPSTDTCVAPVTAEADILSTFTPLPEPAPVLAALNTTLPPSPFIAPIWSPLTSIKAPPTPLEGAATLTTPMSDDSKTLPPLPKLPALLVLSTKPLAKICAPLAIVALFLA